MRIDGLEVHGHSCRNLHCHLPYYFVLDFYDEASVSPPLPIPQYIRPEGQLMSSYPLIVHHYYSLYWHLNVASAQMVDY